MLTIPADATWQSATTCTAGIANVEIAFDSPVVGHIEEAPLAIVEIGLGHDDGVAEVKTPVPIETLSVSCLYRHHCQYSR